MIGIQNVTRESLGILILFLLTGCGSLVSNEVLRNFRFPVTPATDEVLIYLASASGYVSAWEYFSLELNGEYKILNYGDCTYFILKQNNFILRSKRNIEQDPIAELVQRDLSFGNSYYYVRKGIGKSSESPFKETTAKAIAPICAKFGFGRVSNNPPNERWGKNDLM